MVDQQQNTVAEIEQRNGARRAETESDAQAIADVDWTLGLIAALHEAVRVAGLRLTELNEPGSPLGAIRDDLHAAFKLADGQVINACPSGRGNEVCHWTLTPNPDYEVWETDCGEGYQLVEGGPKDNDMRFCCYCGKTLVEQIKKVNGDDD
jgi:hypothetical protein